jgi:predicted regulator of Ras-like GTPase activity (Roadblock/LC7/MglB family)
MIEAASLEERIAKCERILKANANSQVFAPLADALRLRGHLDQAFRICKQGLRAHPEYGAGHLVMARINLDRKMYDWAERELEEAVRLEGDSRASEQLRVEILVAKGELEQAKKLLGRLNGIGGNPLYLQDLTERIRRAEHRKKRAESAGTVAPQPAAQPAGGDGEETPTRLITISDALDALSAFEGITYLVCANQQGIVVEERGAYAVGAEEVAALAAEIYRLAQEETAVGFFGEPALVTAYTQKGTVIVFQLRQYLLALICGPIANLGSLRLKLDEIAINFDES